jgi:hypothetical protein
MYVLVGQDHATAITISLPITSPLRKLLQNQSNGNPGILDYRLAKHDVRIRFYIVGIIHRNCFVFAKLIYPSPFHSKHVLTEHETKNSNLLLETPLFIPN